MKLFNFHTHNYSEEFGIINAKANDIFDSEKQYSMGLHPWDYSKLWKEEFIKIKELAIEEEISAIGETGLDPKSNLKLGEQIEILEEHISLSEELKKPLIIHCVKFYNELIQLKKQHNPNQSWIIHGYRGKLTTARSLINAGFQFSLNASLLVDKQKARELIKLIGIDYLFFETDDNNTNIEIIYNFAAETLNISIIEVDKIVKLNLVKIGL